MENLWNETDYANYRKISLSTAQKERHYGNGPPYQKTGRLVRYDPDIVRAWVAAHTVQSTAETGRNGFHGDCLLVERPHDAAM